MSNNQDVNLFPDFRLRAACLNRATGSGRWLFCLLALVWFNLVWGGALSDPTLPSPSWLAAQPHVQGAAAQEMHEAPPGMQLILIGRSRKFAIIDGQVVKPGDTYNGSKVLDIKSSEVVLQDASKSLKLTPAVEKKVKAPQKSVGATPRVLLNSDGGVR